MSLRISQLEDRVRNLEALVSSSPTASVEADASATPAHVVETYEIFTPRLEGGENVLEPRVIPKPFDAQKPAGHWCDMEDGHSETSSCGDSAVGPPLADHPERVPEAVVDADSLPASDVALVEEEAMTLDVKHDGAPVDLEEEDTAVADIRAGDTEALSLRRDLEVVLDTLGSMPLIGGRDVLSSAYCFAVEAKLCEDLSREGKVRIKGWPTSLGTFRGLMAQNPTFEIHDEAGGKSFRVAVVRSRAKYLLPGALRAAAGLIEVIGQLAHALDLDAASAICRVSEYREAIATALVLYDTIKIKRL